MIAIHACVGLMAPVLQPSAVLRSPPPLMQAYGSSDEQLRNQLAQLEMQKPAISEDEYFRQLQEILESPATLDVYQTYDASQSALAVPSPQVTEMRYELAAISDALAKRLREENAELREQAAANGIPMRAARLGLPLFSLAAGTWGLTQFFKPSSSRIVAGVYEQYQESTRLLDMDPRAEAAMGRYYPGALSSLTTDRIVSSVLAKRGYTRDNTLFATSTCPDEVNSKQDEIVDLFKNRYGENFALGGLGGVPFSGKAGFAAYAHHVPNNGKMFILFAPHVGVESDGKVGKLKRINQAGVSSACGAAVGAFKALMKDKSDNGKIDGVSAGVTDYFDAQINFIKTKLASRLNEVADAPDAQAFVSYQMYGLVREFFVDELLTAPGIWDYANEITVLGGIMVNRAAGGDRFMPLMLQSRTQNDNSVVDLYREAFGVPPEKQLRQVLAGSDIDLFDYKLQTFKRNA